MYAIKQFSKSKIFCPILIWKQAPHHQNLIEDHIPFNQNEN